MLAPPAGPALPGGWERLYPYQQVIPAHGRDHWLLAHAPGLGKTPMGLWFLRPEVCPSALVICPPSIVQQWSDRAETWLGQPFRVCTGGAQVSAVDLRHGVTVVPDSLVHLIPEDVRPFKLILDECHRFKDRSARRTRRIFGGPWVRGERLRWTGLARTAEQVIAMSGTPVLNSPVELYPLLHRCAPAIAPDWRTYTERFCPPTSRWIGALNRNVITHDTGKDLDVLGRWLRDTIMVRPDAAACRTQLPPLMRDTYRVRIEDPSGGMFSEEELTAVFSEEGADAVEQADPQVAELRRMTGEAKAVACTPWLGELIEGGARPVIWLWHREAAMRLAQNLRAPVIHGGSSQAERVQARLDFENGRANALVCTIGAAGTGVDGMQTASHLAIFIERSFVPADNEQAECRLYRAGQMQGVQIVNVQSNAVIDAAIEASLRRKQALIRGTLA